MKRGRIAAGIFIVAGLAAASVGAARGWFRRPETADRAAGAGAERQADVQNVARAVDLIARAAAESPPRDVHPPAPVAPPDTPAAEADKPPPDLRWTVNARGADATTNDRVPCGGKLCAADQFCCGPPECGHCANRVTGPRCPSTCQ